MFHFGRQPLDSEGQVSGKLRFLGDVQHLELIQQSVDVPDAVSAGIAELALRVPPLAKGGNLDRGLLDHAPPSEGPRHGSRGVTLLSNTELVKNSPPGYHRYASNARIALKRHPRLPAGRPVGYP